MPPTIIKPGAGRKPHAPQAAAAEAAPEAWLPPSAGSGIAGLDPLLQAAATLLRTGAHLRTLARHADPEALKASIVELLREYQAACQRLGVPDEQMVAGRYILCTFIDESALGTPWGGSGAWSQHSLLITFHNEGWGGEKVFQLAARLGEDVQRYRGVLELLYVVLALGFEGQHKLLDQGRAQLDGMRERLAGMLRQNTPAPERELSPHWAGAAAAASRPRDGVAVWVVAIVASFMLMLAFAGLRLSAHARSEPVYAALQALDVAAFVRPAVVPASDTTATPPPARLALLLGPEIESGHVEVRDLADRSIVTIRGDGFFATGEAEVAEGFRPLIARIAQALAQLPGPVLVTGHTDDQPIGSLRFPSNWHLSQERARVVGALLSANVDPGRMRTEGRADADPVDPGTTPAGRARNRRVEVSLLSPAAP